MSLGKKELRKSVREELSEALKYVSRASNLLRHNKQENLWTDKNYEALDTADALAQILASTSEYIDYLFSK